MRQFNVFAISSAVFHLIFRLRRLLSILFLFGGNHVAADRDVLTFLLLPAKQTALETNKRLEACLRTLSIKNRLRDRFSGLIS